MKRCSAFKQKKDGQSSLHGDTVFLRRLDGSTLEISKSAINSRLVTVASPSHSPVVLAELDMKMLLDNEITTTSLIEAKFSRRVVLQTWKHYRPKFGPQMQALNRMALSAKLTGNRNGERPLPTLIPKEEMIKLINQGLSVSHIAQKFNTTWHLAKRNIDQASLETSIWASSTFHSVTESQLQALALFNEGLMPAWNNRGQDRQELVNQLYQTFIRVALNLYFLMNLGLRASSGLWTKGLKLPNVCWSLNYHELMFALALDDSKIPYHRQFFPFPKERVTVDFAILNTNVLIEIDGPYHRQMKDSLRDKRLIGAGFQIIRFTLEQVEKSLPDCVKQVLTAMKLSPSHRLTGVKSGTSRLKKITLTSHRD